MPSKQLKINPDLVKERNGSSFNSEEFAVWWHGGIEKLREKRQIDKLFLEDPELQDDTPSAYLSWKERHEHGLRKMIPIYKKLKKLEDANGPVDFLTKYSSRSLLYSQVMGSAILKDNHPYSVHSSMFIYTIEAFGTDEQKARWLDKAWNFQMIGTYAQTELGHGTYIRGLETTATYDAKTKEFILNTPNLTSYKWWPGTLGTNSNYAIVIANLIINDQNYGPHSFMVQTRNNDTWDPMPGVEVGEIGAKMGCNNFNNGFLGLKNVRIPRDDMLMRTAQVLEDGTYIQPPAQVLNYFSMMFIRITIVYGMAVNLAKAATISIRYSAVRHQSPIEPNKPEPQILEHITQQNKLFPLLATAIVYRMTFERFFHLFEDIRKELQQSNLSRLPELHALLSCLKPTCSYTASNGIETMRLACGGHGYMDSSNLSTIYASTVAACTYEGENTVLYLQTARYLMKAWATFLENGKLQPTVSYIGRSHNSGKWDSTIPGIIRAFETVAAQKIRIAYESVKKRKAEGKSHEEATNLSGIQLVRAAEAHARVILVETAFVCTKQTLPTLSTKLGTALDQLTELFIIDAALNNAGDLRRFTNITEADIAALQSRLESLLAKIRPNAVAIVDGFDFHDVCLNSTLGSYDGNVYERLYEEALKSPLNRYGVKDSFEKYIKPLMNSKL